MSLPAPPAMTFAPVSLWRAYPALALAGCLAAGIAVASRQPVPVLWPWLAVGAASLAGATIVAAVMRGRLVSPVRLMWTVAAGLATVAIGGARYTESRLLAPEHVARHATRDGNAVVLEGRIDGTPQVRPYGYRFTLAAERLLPDSAVVSGTVLVTLRQGNDVPLPPLRHGYRITLRGSLRPVPLRRNPADFDYGAYLARKSVHATLTVSDAADVTMLDARCTGRGCRIAAMQAHVRTLLDRSVPTAPARNVLAALILGDRSGIDDETLDQFARTGLMHLLAVSGLHVMLVAMVFYELLRPLLLRMGMGWRAMETSRSVMTLVLLLTYTLLTGAQAPVVRASVMTVLLMGSVLLQRSTQTLNSLGVAALVLLTVRPAHLLEAGFQLSFAAVGAIVTLNPVLSRQLPESWRARPGVDYVWGLLTVSTAATLGTLPVLLYHFGAVSLAGLALNLVAIPITFLTLTAGLATVVGGSASVFAGDAFGSAADLLSRALLFTASAGDAAFSWAVVSVRLRNGWFLLALVTALLVPVRWAYPRSRWRLAAATLLLVAGGVWSDLLQGRYRPGLDVIFFDVGQGDAALVTFPNRSRLLIDAGMRDDYGDQGLRTVLPHLTYYGIDALDAIVVSHPHSDHLGGVPALLRSLPVRSLIHNGRPYESALYREVTALADSLGVMQSAVQAGDMLDLDGSVRIYVLAPSLPDEVDANDASIVLRIDYGQTSFLFNGDVEAEGEAQLVDFYGELLSSDVVKVAHHGSSTSSTPAFVELASRGRPEPPLAVVSVARVNRYGLPNDEVLARWQAQGARLHLTSAAGALWLRSDGRQVQTVSWQ